MDRRISRSNRFTTPQTTADQANDAAASRAFNVEGAYVVGISMGGFVALELALRHPDLVRKLVLTGTSAGGPPDVQPRPEIGALLVQDRSATEVGELSRRTYTLIMATGYAESHPQVMERIAENAHYRPQSVDSYMRQLQACFGHKPSDRSDQIQVPTLVVHGELDPLVPVENGQYLASRIFRAQLICYPDTGHISITSAPTITIVTCWISGPLTGVLEPRGLDDPSRIQPADACALLQHAYDDEQHGAGVRPCGYPAVKEREAFCSVRPKPGSTSPVFDSSSPGWHEVKSRCNTTSVGVYACPTAAFCLFAHRTPAASMS